MKFHSSTLTVLSALLAGQVIADVPVPEDQWETVYNELSDCISSFGFCLDLANKPLRGDTGIELNYKTRDECYDTSLKQWVEPFTDANGFVQEVNKVDAALGDEDVDLFLLRRTAKLPVTKKLTNALTESIKKGGYEGYLRCGNREYVYVYGEKSSVYSKVGDSFEKVAPFDIELEGFDLALPVPTIARLSPFYLVEEEAENVVCKSSYNQPVVGLDGKKSKDTTEFCKNDQEVVENMRLVLAAKSGRTLESTMETAAKLETHFVSHGRTLMGDSAAKDIKVQAVSPNHILVSNVLRSSIRQLIEYGVANEVSAKDVLWAEPREQFSLSNFDASLLLQSGGSRGYVEGSYEKPESFEVDDVLVPFHAAGITGKGQIVGVGDSGLDTNHCHFVDLENPIVDTDRVYRENTKYPGHSKVVNYYSYGDRKTDGPGDHGTHVVGTIVGNVPEGFQNAFESTRGHRGVAYDAKVSFVDVGVNNQYLDIPDDLYNLYLGVQYENGARVQSNSWGVRFGNFYSESCRQFDQFSFDHQDFVALHSAGNADYAKGSSGSVGSPSTSKNVITVGASTNADASWAQINEFVGYSRFYDGCKNFTTSVSCQNGLADFTSNGPTFDGRIKPDVVSPGFFVFSSNSNTTCDLVPKAGTSMATPALAGALALARQYFTEGFFPSGKKNSDDGFVPMGALLKAVAVNSGKKLTGAYEPNSDPEQLLQTSIPNFEQGFGLVQLDNTLVLDGHKEKRSLYLDGDFADMPQVENWEYVEYKFDVAESTNVKATLVWMDVSAITSAKEAIVNDLDLEFYDQDGNQFFPNNRNSRDELNTVEQIEILGIKGSFTLRVVGQIVPQGPQPYSLVVNGNSFTFTGKSEGIIEFEDVVSETSLSYYLAWVFGAITLGGATCLGANKFARKSRQESESLSL